MDISLRLKRIADMVTPGNVVCDVGTDHGYLSIYLAMNKISNKIIAMDVAKGPLERAKSNIKSYECGNVITTRLSDGVKELNDDEIGSIVIAGMGGMLITRLLGQDRDKFQQAKEIILSPHTEIDIVREYLLSNEYDIIDEDMLVCEGKYYVIIKAVPKDIHKAIKDYPLEYIKYGKILLKRKNKVLFDYLQDELSKVLVIREKLVTVKTCSANERLQELDQEIECIRRGLKYYEM